MPSTIVTAPVTSRTGWCPVDPCSMRRARSSDAVDVVRPHHDRILARLGRSSCAGHPPGRNRSVVQRLGRRVGRPHLEGQVPALRDSERHAPDRATTRADAPAVPGRVHREGGDVAVLLHHHQPAEADHERTDRPRWCSAVTGVGPIRTGTRWTSTGGGASPPRSGSQSGRCRRRRGAIRTDVGDTLVRAPRAGAPPLGPGPSPSHPAGIQLPAAARAWRAPPNRSASRRRGDRGSTSGRDRWSRLPRLWTCTSVANTPGGGKSREPTPPRRHRTRHQVSPGSDAPRCPTGRRVHRDPTAPPPVPLGGPA